VAMDLAALAMRLSARAPLSPADLPGGALTLAEAASQLGVTPRSLQRWRRQGLACVRLATPRGSRSGLSAEAMAWCRANLLPGVRSRRHDAASRERLDRAILVEGAAGGSLHEVARRAARIAGVSLATARRAAAKAESRGTVPRLDRRQAVSAVRRAAAWRAWRRGAPLEALALATGRQASSALRAVRRGRSERLRTLRLDMRPLATFAREDAEGTILAPPGVRRGLPVGEWPREASDFLARFTAGPARERPQPVDAHRLAALRFLVWKAAAEARTLRGSDPGPAVDRVETRLRWAARLRIALVERALPGAIERIQAMRGGRLQGLPPASMRKALMEAVRSACRAVDTATGSELGFERPRLVALAAMEAERALSGASWLRPGTAGRDSSVELPRGMRESCVPWSAVVPLRDDLAGVAARSSHSGAGLLVRRMGWDGEAPATPAEAASALGLHPRIAARRTAEAFRALRGTAG